MDAQKSPKVNKEKTKNIIINKCFLYRTIIGSNSKRLRYKRKMTSHYAIMAEKTYDLFELYPELIMKTQILNVQAIHTLKRPQIEEIRNEMMIFAGAANLEEESVNLE
jgi:hypothetical protein